MKIAKFTVLAAATLITAPVFGQVFGLGVQTQLGGQTAGQLSSGGTLNGGLNSAVRGGTAAALNASAGGTDSSIGTMAVGGLADSSSARATGTTPGSSVSDANASSSAIEAACVAGKQTFGTAPIATVKFVAADDTTSPPGAYALTLPIGAPMLGQYSATLPIALAAQTAVAGKYTIEGSANGYTTQSSATMDISTADATKSFVLVP